MPKKNGTTTNVDVLAGCGVKDQLSFVVSRLKISTSVEIARV